MKGKIKVLKISFGFITPEAADEKDIFFHQTDVVGGEAEFKKLKDGSLPGDEADTVEYEMGEGPKGPKATNVKKAGTTDKDPKATNAKKTGTVKTTETAE